MSVATLLIGVSSSARGLVAVAAVLFVVLFVVLFGSAGATTRGGASTTETLVVGGDCRGGCSGRFHGVGEVG